jgi:LCP family protein required for cell wall assembly
MSGEASGDTTPPAPGRPRHPEDDARPAAPPSSSDAPPRPAAEGGEEPGRAASGAPPRRGRGTSEGPGRTPGAGRTGGGSGDRRPPNGRPRSPRPGGGRFARPLTTGALIGWTALSAILPGAAHLRAGRRRIGYILLGVFGVLLAAAAVIGFFAVDPANVGFFTRDSTLLVGAVGAGLGALCWFLLVLSSYITLKPDRLPSAGQIASGIVVGVLCVSVMAPFALTAGTVLTVKDAANDIFRSSADNPSATPVKQEDPWNGRDRVNFLLIGSDAAGNRTGVRTDSMNVASVHIKTGNTVLFSLPRNLQHVHFSPDSPLARQFPNGFFAELPNGGLLNEVWQYAEDHPEIMGARHQGPAALKDAIGHTLGLKIDYYALVSMYGFAELVDAIGGLRIRVEQDVKWGGLYGTAGTIKAGYQQLSGEEALWYGRSRVGSDDFSRMQRQRCVIGAFAQQATPSVVLTNFTKIARAAKRMARTDIPRELLEHIATLAIKVKDAKITSIQFVPPLIFTGRPDWEKIRKVTAKALRDSLQRRALAANVTASPGGSATAGSPTAAPDGTASSPTRKPTPGGTADEQSAKTLDELCGA